MPFCSILEGSFQRFLLGQQNGTLQRLFSLSAIFVPKLTSFGTNGAPTGVDKVQYPRVHGSAGIMPR